MLSGLAIFGAIVGIGRIALAPRPREASVLPVPASRRLALIFMAFIEGHGVLGVVAGIIAIMRGVEVEAATAPVVVILAVVGAVIGLLPIIRNRPELDPWVLSKAIPFMAGLVVLSIVLVILATVIEEIGTATPPAWAFPILGLVSAGASIPLGIAGLRLIEAAAGAEEWEVSAISSRALSTAIPFQAIAVIALAVGIVLVSTGR